ncbi:hypothetical protein HDV62DRAFT_3314 [Trichoderma sp. SZMC 28011]
MGWDGRQMVCECLCLCLCVSVQLLFGIPISIHLSQPAAGEWLESCLSCLTQRCHGKAWYNKLVVWPFNSLSVSDFLTLSSTHSHTSTLSLAGLFFPLFILIC